MNWHLLWHYSWPGFFFGCALWHVIAWRVIERPLRAEKDRLERKGDALAHQLLMSDKSAAPFLRAWWLVRRNRCTVCEPHQ